MQTALTKIWTQITMFFFYDGNCYTTFAVCVHKYITCVDMVDNIENNFKS